MNKTLNTEIIVEQFKEIYGDKYDYSKVRYRGSQRKVEIVCNTCSETFFMIPLYHKKGGICPTCRKRERKVKETEEQDVQNEKKKEIEEIKIYIDKQNRNSIQGNLIHISKSIIYFLKIYNEAIDLKNEYLTENKLEAKNTFLELENFSFPIRFLDLNEEWFIKFKKEQVVNTDPLTKVRIIQDKLYIDSNIEIEKVYEVLNTVYKYISIGFEKELKYLKVDIENTFKEDRRTLIKEPKTNTKKKLVKNKITPKSSFSVGLTAEEQAKWEKETLLIVKSYLIKRGLTINKFSKLLSKEKTEQDRIYRQLRTGSISAALLLKIFDMLNISYIDLKG